MAAVTCQEIRDLFSARVDDALGSEAHARLDAHLATCAECTAEWQRFERTVSLLRAVAPARAPAGFVDRVLAARPRPWYRRLARELFVPWPVKLPLEAAAIVLVAGLAIVIFQRSPELQQAARAPEPPAAVTARPPAMPAPGPREPDTVQGMTSREHQRDLSDETTPRAPGPPPPERRTDSTAAPEAVPPAAPPLESPRSAAKSRAKSAQAPDVGARKEAYQERGSSAARQAAPPTSGDLQTLEARPALLARLRVADRAVAARRAADLVGRAGGEVLSRREEPGALVLSLVVPEGRWDEVRRDLEALGALRLEGDPGRAAGLLRVTLRLED